MPKAAVAFPEHGGGIGHDVVGRGVAVEHFLFRRRYRGDFVLVAAAGEIDGGVARGGQGMALAQFAALAVAAVGHSFVHQAGECGFQPGQRDAILRPLGPGHRRLDAGEIEFQHLRIIDVARLGNAEQALRLVVGADRVDLGRICFQ